MAEILISLTIIGIIAAITLPSLRANINEKTWATQRKALYSRMSQAISMLPSLNGYGIGATDDETASKAAKAFITDGLSKVLKINNICDYEHISDCNLPTRIKNANKSTMNMPVNMSELNSYLTSYGNYFRLKNTYAAAFETNNGDSVLTFYNPYCVSSDVQSTIKNVNGETGYIARQYICLNFIFDSNGKKGPNAVGKDIGVITVLYSTEPSVVLALSSSIHHNNLLTFTSAKVYCKNNGYRLPTLDEAISYFSSASLYGYENGLIWTSTTDNSNTNNAWLFGGYYGSKYSRNKTNDSGYVRCVK